MKKSSCLLNANFVLLWQGQFISLAGTSLSRIALMLWIAEITESATLTGTVMMIATLPGIFLMPLGGAFADRHPRKRIIICCDLLHGGLALALAGAIYLGAGNPSLAIAAILLARTGMTVTDSFFVPAVNAITPDLVPREKLLAANAFIDSAIRVAGLAGKLAGGILYRLLGAPILLLVDGLTFLVSAVSECFIREPGPQANEENTPARDKERGSLAAEVKTGLAYVWQWRGLRAVVMVSAGIHFFMAPLFVLLPFYVTDSRYLGAPADWYGYILAGCSVGTLAGSWLASLLADRLRVPRAGLVMTALVGAGLGIFLMGVFLNPVAVMVLTAAISLLFGLAGNLVSSAIQAGVHGEVRGRVLSVTSTMSMCLSPLAMGLAGALADITERADLILAASGLLLALVVIRSSLSGDYRQFFAAIEEPEMAPAAGPIPESI